MLIYSRKMIYKNEKFIAFIGFFGLKRSKYIG